MSLKHLIILPFMLWAVIAGMMFFPELPEILMQHFDLSDMLFTGLIFSFVLMQIGARYSKRSASRQ